MGFEFRVKKQKDSKQTLTAGLLLVTAYRIGKTYESIES